MQRGANEHLEEADLPEMEGLDLVYVAPLSGKSADRFPEIARRGRAAGAMVAVNPGIRHLTSRGPGFLEALAETDLLSVNRVEAEALVPLVAERRVCPEPHLPENPPDLLDRGLAFGGFDMGLICWLRTIQSFGPRWVLITDGTRGAYLAGPDAVVFHPAIPTEAEGTAGAGDAFCSTLVAALAEGLDPEMAMRQAAVTAASVVAHVDTTNGLMTPDEMAAALERVGKTEARWLA